jgi:cation diffusion facilitator CzcD-associated flavoprotein CzcO
MTMAAPDEIDLRDGTGPEHFDVIVVGAGISGVGAGYRLQTECPSKRYAIFEARDAIGGTWDLMRFPGVRSDSDMYTLAYPFRPWQDSRSIVDGASIREYVRDTASELGVDRHIRFHHRVVRAEWSSVEARWRLEVQIGDDPEPVRFTTDFLYLCSGYYRYDAGYLPEFPGRERFAGPVVHPQHWPEDLDYSGKRVVVIGSGATAVTLIPAMARTAAHVTMLQRSPSYVVSVPGEAGLHDLLARLPDGISSRIIRWFNVVMTTLMYQLCRHRPALARKMITSGAQRLLPDDFPIDPHFTPTYEPWDQRMCLVPDGDLFAAIGSGRASVVTDRIETFTETGIDLESGASLDADVIVTATGLEMLAWGGIEVSVDGVVREPGKSFFYRGFMMSDIPNMAVCIGYTNASWTLRADLTSRSVCRLLNLMERRGYVSVVAPLGNAVASDTPSFALASNYVKRAADRFPRVGTTSPWYLRQNYVIDAFTTRFGDLTKGLEFSRRRHAPAVRS